MSNSNYTTQFHKALDLYFDHEYAEALKIFQVLLNLSGLDSNQTAELLRRVADCQTHLGNAEMYLSNYDNALDLIDPQKDETQRLWILASKAYSLGLQKRYLESLACFAEAIKLVKEPEDLEHLESEVEEVLNKYHYFQDHGNFEDWKANVLKKISSFQEEIEKEEFWKLAKGKVRIKG